MKPKIAITPGDVNGVGYEIILKTLNEPHILELCTPIIYGSARIAQIHRKTMDEIVVNLSPVNSPREAGDRKVSIINCNTDDIKVQFGRPAADSALAAYQSLERACTDLDNGLVDAIVTAPINKQTIQSADFHFPGHTEYLSSKFSIEGKESLMMLVNGMMRVALVTNHMPISQVSQAITQDLIVSKLKALNDSLCNDFSIRRPRIAVLALNPHNGDDGLLGMEEKQVILPAIEQARQLGICAFGTFSSDGFFGAAKYKDYDAILAMYHDQGLIPFKALDMTGVNYTAGLRIVRTSPDHGTAFEIAGRNMADEQSFRESIYLAVDVLNNRQMNAEITSDSLPYTPLSHQPRQHNE
ncbi:MAG: 4-hydroxythreonine-4-phosphate dehydrogenase PdxA [Paludibacteraceae bacterium]|nr:4-hydroxythreonine-4-phosphate dehydrogenase PdxA [Paludibacteraceae bacterium]